MTDPQLRWPPGLYFLWDREFSITFVTRQSSKPFFLVIWKLYGIQKNSFINICFIVIHIVRKFRKCVKCFQFLFWILKEGGINQFIQIVFSSSIRFIFFSYIVKSSRGHHTRHSVQILANWEEFLKLYHLECDKGIRRLKKSKIYYADLQAQEKPSEARVNKQQPSSQIQSTTCFGRHKS